MREWHVSSFFLRFVCNAKGNYFNLRPYKIFRQAQGNSSLIGCN